MATADFIPQLVRESRLNDVSSQIDYAVRQGPSQSSYQQYNANTQSTSNVNFVINPPSESVVLDRRLLFQAKLDFTVTVSAGVKQDDNVFPYGFGGVGFKPFPLSNLITVASANINNTSVSVNLQDILPSLLRTMDIEDLAEYQNMSPIYPDNYKDYKKALQTNNNPLAGFGGSDLNNRLIPRGAHPMEIAPVETKAAGGTANTSVASADGSTFVITCSAVLTEPLWISPFLTHSKHNHAGLLGVNNITLNFNIDSSMKQSFAYAPVTKGNLTYAIALTSISESKIFVNYLTPSPSFLLPARNIVPFTDYVRMITSTQNSSQISAGATTTSIRLNNIQLNSVPDKIMIIARKPLSSQTYADSQTFMAIKKCIIDFNNVTGIMSNATQQDLWRTSVANGSKQSWYGFSGEAYNGDKVYTEGSVVILDPVRDFNLPSYLANGSLGQFALQIQLDVYNNSAENITPEFVVIIKNDGYFACIAGSAVVRTGLLNMDTVTQLATQSNAISSNELSQATGGALSDQVASALKGIPLVKGKAGARSGGAKKMMGKLDSLAF